MCTCVCVRACVVRVMERGRGSEIQQTVRGETVERRANAFFRLCPKWFGRQRLPFPPLIGNVQPKPPVDELKGALVA